MKSNYDIIAQYFWNGFSLVYFSAASQPTIHTFTFSGSTLSISKTNIFIYDT